MAKVSVVIPSFGRPTALSRCISSVLGSYDKEIELIIVDSPREGEHASAHIKLKDPRVIILRLPARAFASHARNIGYEAASGEYIFFLDDDNTVNEETIPRLVDTLKDSSIGVSGPISYYFSNSRIVQNAGTYKSKFFRLHRQYSFPNGYPALYDSDIIPNAFMTKREVLDNVGVFDSHNFKIQEEESDLQWRCRERGFRTVICSGAAVFHDISISGPSHFSPETIQESFKSRFWIERKHRVGNVLGLVLSAPALSAYYVVRVTHSKESHAASYSVPVAIARGIIAGLFGKMTLMRENGTN